MHKAYVPAGVLGAVSPIYSTLTTGLANIMRSQNDCSLSPTLQSLVLCGYGVMITEQPDQVPRLLIKQLCLSCLQLLQSQGMVSYRSLCSETSVNGHLCGTAKYPYIHIPTRSLPVFLSVLYH